MTAQIYQNTLKFLERVQATGLESYAWCEAHAFFSQKIQELAQAQVAQTLKGDGKDAASPSKGNTSDSK